MLKANINPFQSSVVFHIETSHLFCRAKQMTGFYMKQQHWAGMCQIHWSNIFDTSLVSLLLTSNLFRLFSFNFENVFSSWDYNISL